MTVTDLKAFVMKRVSAPCVCQIWDSALKLSLAQRRLVNSHVATATLAYFCKDFQHCGWHAHALSLEIGYMCPVSRRYLRRWQLSTCYVWAIVLSSCAILQRQWFLIQNM